jgi:hypothetical protein
LDFRRSRYGSSRTDKLFSLGKSKELLSTRCVFLSVESAFETVGLSYGESLAMSVNRATLLCNLYALTDLGSSGSPFFRSRLIQLAADGSSRLTHLSEGFQLGTMFMVAMTSSGSSSLWA